MAIRDKNIEWYLHMRLEPLLKNIQKVLRNMKNLEVVAASLYFVVNSLPLGNYLFPNVLHTVPNNK